MVRSLRFEYACVVCHVMARGGGGKAVFIAKDAHLLFLHWLCDEKGKLLASRKGDPLKVGFDTGDRLVHFAPTISASGTTRTFFASS